MLVADTLLEELLMGVRLEKFPVVQHLVRSYLVPDDSAVLRPVEPT